MNNFKRLFKFELKNDSGESVENQWIPNIDELPEELKKLMSVPFEKDKVIEIPKCKIFGEVNPNMIFGLKNHAECFIPLPNKETGETVFQEGTIKLSKVLEEDGQKKIVILDANKQEEYMLVFDRNHKYAGIELEAKVTFLDEDEFSLEEKEKE